MSFYEKKIKLLREHSQRVRNNNINDNSSNSLKNEQIDVVKKKTLLIGTTAINRSVLHNEMLPGWYKFINALDRNIYDIYWFINVDFIEKLKEDVETTKNNLRKIIKNIPITFIEKKNKDGHFLNACRNIAINMENKIKEQSLCKDDVIVFWLEDDWKLSDNIIPLQLVIENYLSNLTYINLSFIRKNYIHALAPSIINYNLWSKIQLIAWKTQTDKYVDPEHCAGLYFIKNFCKYDDIRNMTIVYDNYKMKEIDDIYKDLTRKSFFDYTDSYYTYHDESLLTDLEKKNNHYIEKSNVKDFNNDIIVFIRLMPSYCKDGVLYGRNFMVGKFGLVKNKDSVDFYKDKK